MTTYRDGLLSRPRGGSVQWQGDGAGPTLLRAEFFGAALSPVAGTLSATLADATLAAAGTVSSAGGVSGTLSGTLGAATAVSAGTVRVGATASSTLAAATVTSASTLRVSGVLSGTLGTALASGAGGLTVAGTLAQTLGAAEVASTGTTRIAAAVAQALADATLSASGALVAPGSISGSLAATLADAVLTADGAGDGAPVAGPTPAGRGSNLSDIWEFREKPFAVRVKGKRKAYKTARQAATAVKEALRSAPADAVSVELEGQPVTLPALEFAPFRDVLARLMVLEQRREQAAENHRKAQAAERERIRRAQEADDEEALVLLLRAWRL